MPKITFSLSIVTLLIMGWVKIDDSCDQDLYGEYEGFDTSVSLNGSGKIAQTVTIIGSDGSYQFSFSRPNGIDPSAIEQDRCEFRYSTGSFGTKRSGDFSFDGDTLLYSISGDGFGTLPFSFKGVRK